MAFDTDAIIYFVEEHDQYLPIIEPVFRRVDGAEVYGHASVVSLLEVLAGPMRAGREDLVERYRAILTRSRNFQLHDLTASLADIAADFRARFNLRTPDAIVAASAVAIGPSYLVTNDPVFKRLDEGDFKVLQINDYI